MNPIYRHKFVNTFFIEGYAISSTTGNPVANANYSFTEEFIEVSNIYPKKLFMSSTPQAGGAFYDYKKKYISGFGFDPPATNTEVDIPNNAYYVRLNYSIASRRNGTASLKFGSRDADNYIAGRLMSPTYKDDLTKDLELETNQRFYRAKLSGKISFIREDYDYMNSQLFEYEFMYLIEKSNDLGKTWGQYYMGKFMKTDCQWDRDNRKVIVKPDPWDAYNDVLAGLEKEYNLIELAPSLTPVVLRKRPLIQLYVQGDSVLSCFIGGTYWEQTCDVITSANDLERKYYFALNSQIREVNVTGSGSYNISGLYGGKDGTYRTSDGLYYMEYKTNVIIDLITENVFVIFRTSDDEPLYVSQSISSGPLPDGTLTFQPYPNSGATGTFSGDTAAYNVWLRYLLDREYLSPHDTYPIPQEDMTDDNLNYRYCIGIISDTQYISLNFSTEPTQYGRADSGLYFRPPYSIAGTKFYPVAKSRWRHASIWFAFSLADWLFEPQGRQPYVLRDCYDFASIIQVLLNQFSSGITHRATTEFSQFLYSDRNPISGNKYNLVLSQKSNLLHGSLAQPAQKAPITLRDITNLLRDCYRCYWYIDEQRRFRIEHIEWFRNGGTYGGGLQYTADLTELTNIRNDKKWGFATSAWDFDKVDMPERFQFKWMDDCTESFEGYPIEVISKYVTAGKIEDVNVSKFTSDVDFMLMNPNAIAQDGFALFAAVNENALPVDYPGYSFYNGLIASDGTIQAGTASGQNGYGWMYTQRDAIAGQEYRLIDNTGAVINTGVYWHFFDIRGISMGRASTTSGSVTVPSGCYTLGLSFRIQSDSTPTTLNVLEDYYYRIASVQCRTLSLPFVTFGNLSNEIRTQNGYASWLFLHPSYYPYDLPARRVKINGSEYFAYGIDRKKKQTVEYPSIDDPNPMQLIKTYIGSGQIDKLSVNLHSRMNKITLKYDTE